MDKSHEKKEMIAKKMKDSGLARKARWEYARAPIAFNKSIERHAKKSK